MTFWNFDKVYFTILVNSERFWPLQFTSYKKHIDFRGSSFEIFSKFMFLLCFAKIGTVVAISRIFQKLLFLRKIYFMRIPKCHVTSISVKKQRNGGYLDSLHFL